MQVSTSASRHVLGALVEALLVVAITSALAIGVSHALGTDNVSSALAGGRAASTSAITVPDGVFAGETTAQAGAAYMWVHATCSQGGTVVYAQWVKTDANGRGTFTLGPTPMWSSGSASCWAEDGVWNKSRWRQSSTTTFNVTG